MITADDYAAQLAAAQEAIASAHRHAAAVAALAPIQKTEKVTFQASEDGQLLIKFDTFKSFLTRAEVAVLRKWLEETFP